MIKQGAPKSQERRTTPYKLIAYIFARENLLVGAWLYNIVDHGIPTGIEIAFALVLNGQLIGQHGIVH